MRARDDKKGRAFLDELVELYEKHKLCISHEELQGEFVIREINDHDIEWIAYAGWKKGKE